MFPKKTPSKLLILILIVFGFNAYGQYGSSSLNWPTWEYDSLSYKSAANANTSMPYRLLKPTNFSPASSEKYPMMIMLHGLGEGMGESCSLTNGNNICQLAWGGKMHLDSIDRHPGFVLFPQTFGGGWSSGDGSGDYNPESSRSIRILVELLDSLFRQYPIDLNRVYIHGLSGGGQGVWEMFITYPGLFAAASPHSATGNLDSAKVILFNPMWTVQGERDENPRPENSIKMMDSLAKRGAKPILTYDTVTNKQIWPDPYTTESEPIYSYIPNTAHAAWPFLYNSPNWQNWLYHQNKLRVRVIGDLYACKDRSHSVTLGISPKLEEYEWRKNGVTITGSNTHKLDVNEPGTYQVRFKRKKYYFSGPSEWSEWSYPVEIPEKEALPAVAISASGSTALNGLDGSTSVTLSAPAGFQYYDWSNGSTSQSISVSNPGSYSVTVNNDNICRSPLAKAVVTTGTNSGAPVAPTNLTARSLGKTKVYLEWKDMSHNEKSFEIYRKKSGTSAFTFAGLAPENTSFIIDSLAAPGTRYTYQIRAINYDGYSSPSNTAIVTTLPDATAPAAPVSLVISHLAETSVTLSWAAASDDMGIAGYVIYLNDDSVSYTSSTSVTLTGLTNQTFYTAFIKSRDHAGNKSNASAQVSFVTSFNGLNYSYYEGTWNYLPDFSTLTPKATGWIENFSLSPRKKDNYFAFKFTGFIKIPVTGTYTFYTSSDDGSKLYINGEQIVDNDGLHGTVERSGSKYLNSGVYPLEVTFFEKTGGQQLSVAWQGPGITKQLIPNSSLTNQSIPNPVAPSAPSGLSATAFSASAINVKWSDVNNENHYEIYRSLSSSGTYVHVGTVPANTLIFKDSALTPSTRYYYQVKATGSTGESPLSAKVNTVTLSMPSVPSAPANLYSQILGNYAELNWTDNSGNEDYFTIEYSADNVTFTTFAHIGPGLTTFKVTGIDPGDSFYFRLRAGNAAGLSEASNTVEVIAEIGVPKAPSGLQANVISASNIEISWNDNSSDEAGFILEKRLEPSGEFYSIANLQEDATLSIDRGEAGVTYSYRVRAYNTSGYSLPATLTITVPAKPLRPNTASWKIAATAVSHNSSNPNLTNALLNKQDFFEKIAISAGQTFTLNAKIPSLSNDGMLIFNINSYVNTSTTTLNDFVQVKAYISSNSTNGTDGNWQALPDPFIGPYNGDLQKFDILHAYSEKWIRLEFINTHTANIDVYEFGLYEFPLTGKAQYFVFLGASLTDVLGAMTEFKPELDAFFQGKNYEPVVFNLAVSAKNSTQLSNMVDDMLDRHPHAAYVFIEIGGNDVSQRRPLTYDQLDGFYTNNFINSYNYCIDAINVRGMVPVVADLTFRNYKEEKSGTQPSVEAGARQEYGSLPYNYLINKILIEKSPEFYDFTTKRGKIDFYPLTLNNQSLLRSDGVHIINSEYDVMRDFWIKYGFNYIYEGVFAEPIIYNEYRVNLHSMAQQAVSAAEQSGLESDVWTARLLVEEIGDAAIRVPLHIRLDEIDPRVSPDVPFAPSLLSATDADTYSIYLAWKDNSYSEASFEIFRSSNPSGPYSLIAKTKTDETFYTDNDLRAGARYYYKIRASNKSGASAFTDVVSEDTPPAFNLNWDGGNGSGIWEDNLNWSGDSLPSAGAIVKLDNSLVTGKYTVSLNEELTGIQRIEIGGQDTITFTVGGNVSKVGVSNETSLVIHQNGKVTFNNKVKVFGNLVLNGELNVSADSVYFNGSVTGTGKLNLSPGTVVVYQNNSTSLFPGIYNDLIININDSSLIPRKLQVNGKLEIRSGKVVSNGNLLLNLDRGYLVYDDEFTGTISGDMGVKKTVNHSKYTYLGSPLHNINKGQLTKNGSMILSSHLLTYDESVNTRTKGNYTSGWKTANDPLPAPGYGMAAYFRYAGALEFYGECKNTTALVNLSYTAIESNPEFDGWNLIANPFLTDLDWDQVVQDVSDSEFEKAIYYFNGSRYITYLPGFGPDESMKNIPALQGFFVHASKPTTLLLKNPDRKNSSSQLYKKAAIENTLKISMSDGISIDETFIRILNESTVSFDGQYDGYKFFNAPGMPNLYTELNSVKYSVNCFPLSVKRIEVPLKVVSSATGQITLNFTETGVFTDVIVYFKDKVTGEQINVTSGGTYTFTNQSVPNRFALVFESTNDKIVEPSVLYRVNCGGYEVSDSVKAWEKDRQTDPCSYVSPQSSNNTTGSTEWNGENYTHAPDSIFGTNRYDGPWGYPLEFIFPVEPGQYLVRMYFAEKPNNVVDTAERIFDILIENTFVEKDVDIFREAQLNALEKEFYVQITDEDVNISFETKVYNPQVNGIEIILMKPLYSMKLGATKESSESLVYPNPVTDLLNLKTSENVNGAAELQIYDSRGILIKREFVSLTAGLLSTNQIKDLEPGIYFLKLLMAEKTITGKFEKR